MKSDEITPMGGRCYDSSHDFSVVGWPKVLDGGLGGIGKDVSFLYIREELPRMLSKLSRNNESVPRRKSKRPRERRSKHD